MLGLLHPKKYLSYDLIIYSNTDFVRYKVDKKLHIKHMLVFKIITISWSSWKLNFVALSNTEAKNIVVSNYVAQVL